LRVAAHVHERQYSDGRPLGGRTFDRVPRGDWAWHLVGQMNAMNADRPGNILDRLFSQIVEVEAEFILDLIVYHTRNHDAAGIGKGFQPRRNVNAIAIGVVTSNDIIAEINTDVKLQAFGRRDIDVAFKHPLLNVDCATHRIDHASKFDQHAVTGRLDNTAAVFGDLRVDELLAVRLKLAER